jgi:hypothetical protein
MSELSDNAQSLAETLCGSEFRHHNGTLSRWEGMGELGEVETIRYDKQALLNLAAAALELAGVRIEWQEYVTGPQRNYRTPFGINTLAVGTDWTPDGEGKPVWIELPHGAITIEQATHLAAILLHAAATAREWEEK